MMGKFKRVRILVQVAIGVAIILWLIQLADLSRVYSTILGMNPINIIIASSFFIVASFFVALAFYVSLKRSHPTAPLRKVVMSSFAGQLLSDITPVRSGYFLTPFILNKLSDVPVERGMTGVLATGGVNSIVKVVLCLVGIAYFIRFLPLEPWIINALLVGASFLLVAGLFLLLLMWEKRLSRLVEKFETLPLIGKSMHKLIEMFNNVQREGQKVKGSLIQVAVLILFSVITNATALYSISLTLWNSSLSIVDFFFMTSLASALMYIPITIAGLGVQEAGYVVLLSLLLKLPLDPLDSTLVVFALITRVLFTGTDIIGIVPLLKVGLKYK